MPGTQSPQASGPLKPQKPAAKHLEPEPKQPSTEYGEHRKERKAQRPVMPGPYRKLDPIAEREVKMASSPFEAESSKFTGSPALGGASMAPGGRPGGPEKVQIYHRDRGGYLRRGAILQDDPAGTRGETGGATTRRNPMDCSPTQT